VTAHDLVVEAASCWLGGLWSDSLGESGPARDGGIEGRCIAVLHEVDLGKLESEWALTWNAPPPGPHQAYYALRAIEPRVVNAIAHEVQLRAARDPNEAPHAAELDALLAYVADAARETMRARRAADVVKEDVVSEPSPDARRAAKAAAAVKLRSGKALDALMRADVGKYTEEARAFALMIALDRMQIARGLPKHLKIYAVGVAFAGVFGVPAPVVSDDAPAPVKSGVWLAYLSDVAAAAGHPVPADARDPQNREPLAWTGVLEGFADKLRDDAANFAPGTPIGDVQRGMIVRLDRAFRDQREVFAAHAPADR
jgi:hypothetical protein